MTDHLLDANAMIDYFRRRRSTLTLLENLDAQGHRLAICAVGLAELYSGFSLHQRIAADPVVDKWLYYETTQATAKEAGRYRYEFARRGITLSAPDSLIAAVAITHNAILVTNNVRDFQMDNIRIVRHD